MSITLARMCLRKPHKIRNEGGAEGGRAQGRRKEGGEYSLHTFSSKDGVM